jgi:hypothetical protein
MFREGAPRLFIMVLVLVQLTRSRRLQASAPPSKVSSPSPAVQALARLYQAAPIPSVWAHRHRTVWRRTEALARFPRPTVVRWPVCVSAFVSCFHVLDVTFAAPAVTPDVSSYGGSRTAGSVGSSWGGGVQPSGSSGVSVSDGSYERGLVADVRSLVLCRINPTCVSDVARCLRCVRA